jgi:hydroxyacylglutathione hydrolase
MDELMILPLPAFKDNYIWALRLGRRVVVVDPGDAQPVRDYLSDQDLTLAAILITHHHADHVGGLLELKSDWTVPVYGPRHEPIKGITVPLAEGDRVDIAELGLRFEVLDIPGHTRAHIAYYGQGLLFCGDTLFACGCGRLFEGTAAQMHASLSKLAALPDETRVFCAHEYTLANIKFARAVEPANAAIAARARSDAALREAGQPTLPSTIGLEKATNPFLRVSHPDVVAAARNLPGVKGADPIEVFAAIRQWKNEF